MSNSLKETISNLQKDFTANPKNAVVQYESNSILKEGLQSVVTLREHKLTVDEPKSFGGKRRGTQSSGVNISSFSNVSGNNL
ncbi:hypothetical protein ABXT43_06405 [Candidatus Pelagibacter sp. Uisw_114]